MATLLQRLDVELHSFTDFFANLIKASRIVKAESSKSQASRHEYFFSAKVLQPSLAAPV